MRMLVMGCGRVGAMIVRELVAQGHEVTVMDSTEENLRRIPPSSGAAVLLGDGTRNDDLRWAGIEEVDAFLAVAQGDARNAFAAQKAVHEFHVPRVVCLVNDPVRQEMYRDLGLNAVSPAKLISNMIIDALEVR